MLKLPLVSPFFSKEDPSNPICPALIQVGGAERLRDEIIYTVKDTYRNSPIRLEIYEGGVSLVISLS
jgi:acetyl esterase/lipase